MKQFDTFTNSYQDDSRQYISSITQFSVGYCTILFPLNFKKHFSQYLIWYTGTCGRRNLNIIWLIIDLNISDRSDVDFQVRWIYLHILLCTVLSRVERGGSVVECRTPEREVGGFETYRRRVVSFSKTLYSPKVLVNYPGSGGSVPTWLKNCWLGR